MTTMFDIFGDDFLEELELELQAGYIRERSHPEFPELTILNYTEKAAFEGHWNEYTLTCRGLIVNRVTHTILARPFRKFFNLGQAGAPELAPDTMLWHVANKEDGSLGIGYIRPDGEVAIATRGSFESEQALHATENLTDVEMQYIRDAIFYDFTPLYEIIYPENRIVLNYGERDELIPLGTIDITDGEYYPEAQAEGGLTLNRVLNTMMERENAEGYVLWVSPFTAVKVKQQDYIELHRIVTGLNRKSIWRALVDGTYEEKAAQFPDELYAWADGVKSELELEAQRHHSNALAQHIYVTQELRRSIGFQIGAEWTQKEFALKVQEIVPKEYQGLVFLRQAGKHDQVKDRIWKMIEPIGGDK